jgi:hypothetical protein
LLTRICASEETAARKARLADAGLAREQHQLAFASFGLLPSLQHQCQFMIPADHVGHGTGCAGFEPAFSEAFPDHPVSGRLTGNSLQILAAKMDNVEHIA